MNSYFAIFLLAIGLIILILGLLRKSTVYLELTSKGVIKSNVQDFVIDTNDNELTFRMGRMILLKEDESILKLVDLELDYHKIPEICSWINQQLPGNPLFSED